METLFMQNFGGQSKRIMVVLKVFYLLYQSFRTSGCPIGHLHDGVILLSRPECFFKMLSYSDLSSLFGIKRELENFA